MIGPHSDCIAVFQVGESVGDVCIYIYNIAIHQHD